ncbi:Bacillosamine/Legionaminic acid biosynthesis aminotransferase PglE 4-keto-6-deoxy-N-Acetyl-D-hexosaminyl-(Lipid carrier) aminotransferase [Paramagnetospirillum magnetotacticum MS-1]|uniref:Bacillosamine/Legionaminic acid biosynthesis aminotransferase PglE 4-keto-6-deoxy-N-Acetyl-D-hexosaminyl-(Lipid carrier) aminotransferase n=1 Tax=Paramagnetospirillum magnetotacticum MS-1 TaxID=272627 RepID=A0A0C2U8G8_PARME|nr:LegC family aminotransferase [Paramagnetospirillum magnetotacticum]KIL97797.1 Bacillosamine/Legionaminic acid biosynthesis aminotransferase PglE 4-keto-6-deoxy-N-Acetyl-D-hexosaminyl-(Lipid carrier) aminotransferase [Paramagnetospirillum magnetotacticum MS-1]
MHNEIICRLEAVWRRTLRVDGPVPLHAPVFEGHEWEYVKDCLDTGWVSSVGAYVDRFEAMLADITGAHHAVATVNGSAALEVCLHLAGVGAGDDVVLPSLTFIATANAVSHLGASCRFVDVDEATLGLDPARLDDHLARHGDRPIKAVVVMHTFGHAADLDGLMQVCARHGVPLIEDAAESLGSYSGGRHTGTSGLLSALSFNGNKIVTTGGGGAVLTNDPDLARRAKHLTTTAKLSHPYRFDHDEVGWNYRLPNLNAALGCAQLEALPAYLGRKRRLASLYQEAFADLPGVKVVADRAGCAGNFWLNALILDRPDRDLVAQVIEGAAARGLQCRPIWTPMHRLPMYRYCPRDDLAVTEALEDRLINIPSSPSPVLDAVISAGAGL